MGVPFGAGIQFLFDQHQKFVRAGAPVYLRVRKFLDEGDYLEVGVPFSPTGVAAAESGYSDILITPPPSVQDVSLHNIGLLAARLNFGSRVFLISNSWVQAQMQALSITDPRAVFRQRNGYYAIGLFHTSHLYSIESITNTTVAGQPIVWKVVGNFTEPQSDSPTL